MEQNAQRIFYTSIGAEIPYQRNFFSYDPDAHTNNEKKHPVLVRWEECKKLSYSELLGEETIKQIDSFSTWMQCLPFVEQVFLAWWVTFWEKSWIIDIVVVSNTKRMRCVKIMLMITLYFFNMYWKKKTESALRLSLMVDRVWSDCSWIRSWVWDLMSPYWIAHLVCVYEQYEQWSTQFFKANAWIQYTLPNHPLRSVIQLGVVQRTWIYALRKRVESLFWWILWDWLNGIIFQVHTLFSNEAYRYEKTSRATPWVWWENIRSKRSLLKRKVSKKKYGDS